MEILKLIGIVLLCLIVSCVSKEETIHEKTTDIKPTPSHRNRIQHLNITILLDVSDRVCRSKNPIQEEKDLQIIHNVLEMFQKEVKDKLYLASKSKLRVKLAYQDKEQRNGYFLKYMDKLNIDLEKYPIKNRKKELQVAIDSFLVSIGSFYKEASTRKQYKGCDIWDFLKNDVGKYIQPPTGSEIYQNVLIVLTDGYIQFTNHNRQSCEGNRCHFLYGMNTLRKAGENWKEVYEKRQYGLIPFSSTHLQYLDVLVLEVQPKLNGFLYEFDALEHYWKDWLHKSGVEYLDVSKTSDPESIYNYIQGFFLKIGSKANPQKENEQKKVAVIP